jgi:hypothetical protein
MKLKISFLNNNPYAAWKSGVAAQVGEESS